MPPTRRIAPFVQRARTGGAVLIGSRPRSTNAGSTRASFRLYRANRPILIAPSSALGDVAQLDSTEVYWVLRRLLL